MIRRARYPMVGLLGLLTCSVSAGCGDDDGAPAPDAGPDSATVLCGNEVVEGIEECDDGQANNDLLPDACRTDCRLPWCGDGTTDTGEECDDGLRNSDVVPDACRQDCTAPRCGDGVVDVAHNETCDDGNTLSGDGCSASCLVEFCGNGETDPGEVCDDGNYVAGDGCSPDCRSDEICGNGYPDFAAGETCDCGVDPDNLPVGCAAPNGDPASPCTESCQTRYCGNGVIEPGEACDDGNTVSGDGCSPDCRSDETCGNGIVDVALGEQCDDGNQVAGDGCGPSCRVEYCGNGLLDPGELCDDGNHQGGDGCSADCLSLEGCGNGYVDVLAGEACDLGLSNSDAPNAICRTDCQAARCGDGILDDLRGEVCESVAPLGLSCQDFGFYSGTLGCSPYCTADVSGCSAFCGDGVVQGPELCDGAPPAGLDCADFGFSGGSLGCSALCSLDFTGCT